MNLEIGREGKVSKMGEKPEVLDAVLKETVDLVMDLSIKIGFFMSYGFLILMGFV